MMNTSTNLEKNVGLLARLQTQKPVHQMTELFLTEAKKVILDKDSQLTLCLCSILSRGHLLIEDIPGVGKTTMVKVVSQLAGLETRRIQFTNDLLPADIIGSMIYDQKLGQFTFHKGPLFSQVVIGDELNRANPRTQSAFLQAMEERKVTVEGVTHSLPEPFFLVATQNPQFQTGTFPLPESQLDRFLMRLSVGYPNASSELELLMNSGHGDSFSQLKPLMTPEKLIEYQSQAQSLKISQNLAKYIHRILEASRSQPKKYQGLSPRAGLDLVRASKSWAFLNGREIVVPEDVQAVAVAVLNHRLSIHRSSPQSDEELARELLRSVPVEP